MKKIMVELDEGDVARLEAVAQQCGIDVATLAYHALRNVAEGGTVAMRGVMQAKAAYKADRASAEVEQGAPPSYASAAVSQARFAALMASSGIWNGEASIPKDGLRYQQKLRAEWH